MTGLINDTRTLPTAQPKAIKLAIEALMTELFWCGNQLGLNWKDERWRKNSSVGRAYDQGQATLRSMGEEPPAPVAKAMSGWEKRQLAKGMLEAMRKFKLPSGPGGSRLDEEMYGPMEAALTYLESHYTMTPNATTNGDNDE